MSGNNMLTFCPINSSLINPNNEHTDKEIFVIIPKYSFCAFNIIYCYSSLRLKFLKFKVNKLFSSYFAFLSFISANFS